MSRYLSAEELELFKQFLNIRKVGNTKISRILDIAPSGVTYYFKSGNWQRTDFEKVRKELRAQANIGFDLIDEI